MTLPLYHRHRNLQLVLAGSVAGLVAGVFAGKMMSFCLLGAQLGRFISCRWPGPNDLGDEFFEGILLAESRCHLKETLGLQIQCSVQLAICDLVLEGLCRCIVGGQPHPVWWAAFGAWLALIYVVTAEVTCGIYYIRRNFPNL